MSAQVSGRLTGAPRPRNSVPSAHAGRGRRTDVRVAGLGGCRAPGTCPSWFAEVGSPPRERRGRISASLDNVPASTASCSRDGRRCLGSFRPPACSAAGRFSACCMRTGIAFVAGRAPVRRLRAARHRLRHARGPRRLRADHPRAAGPPGLAPGAGLRRRLLLRHRVLDATLHRHRCLDRHVHRRGRVLRPARCRVGGAPAAPVLAGLAGGRLGRHGESLRSGWPFSGMPFGRSPSGSSTPRSRKHCRTSARPA